MSGLELAFWIFLAAFILIAWLGGGGSGVLGGGEPDVPLPVETEDDGPVR